MENLGNFSVSSIVEKLFTLTGRKMKKRYPDHRAKAEERTQMPENFTE